MVDMNLLLRRRSSIYRVAEQCHSSDASEERHRGIGFHSSFQPQNPAVFFLVFFVLL